MEIIFRKMAVIILSVLLTAGAFGFYGLEESYDTLLFVLSVFAVHGLLLRFRIIRNKRAKGFSIPFALLLTAAFAVGHQVNTEIKPHFPAMHVLDWAYLIPFGMLVYVCIVNLVDWVLDHTYTFVKEEGISKKYWGKAFLIITALWIPYFLVFYPGNISLDSFEVIQQAVGVMPYTSNHPVAFTAFISAVMKLGMRIGDINFGIACFSAIQMLVLSGILSYVLYWMKTKGIPTWVIFLTGAYFALNPVIATFSVTMWKDVLFGGVFLLLMIFLYDVYESDGRVLSDCNGLMELSGISIFLSLWRNGIVVGIAALMLLLAIRYRKYAKRVVPVCLVVLILIFVLIGPVYNGLNLPGSHAAESLGIPLQQIGYTIEQGGTIDAESGVFLNRLMPLSQWPEAYSPGGSDGIKFDSSFDTEFLDQNTHIFIQTWMKLMSQNAIYYLKAWLMNTLGYFHIGTSDMGVWYGIIPVEGVEEMQIFRTDLIHAFLGTDLPARVIEAFIFFMNDLPAFNMIYSIAVSVWLVFLALFIFLLRRKKGENGCFWLMLPLSALWCIMMVITPVNCSFRYMFAFHLALPIILLSLFWNMDGGRKASDGSDVPICKV